jgi:hypothetical protein
VLLAITNRELHHQTYHRVSLIIDLARQFQVDTTKDRPLLPVNVHGTCDLMDDIGKVSSLERGVCLRVLGANIMIS